MADDLDFARIYRGLGPDANALALSAMDESPDDAVRAQHLGEATGIPAIAVHSDLDNVDRQFRAASSSAIIDSNKFIKQYILSDPMASKVSTDDWGQLDEFSQKAGGLKTKGFWENTGDVIHEVWEGLSKGPQGFKEIQENARKYLLDQGMDAAAAEKEAQVVGGRFYRGEAMQNILMALPTIIGSPAIGAFRTYAAQPLEAATGFPAHATEQAAMVALGALGLGHMMRTAKVAEPYIQAGKVPPVGVDPVIDQLHIKQSEADLASLNDALKSAVATNTRERSPELFANFVRQITDGDIGVSAEAIRALYGDKVPAPDDGLLGWVPRINEQMLGAESVGGDVSIPIADWLARVEPQVAKQLEEFVRVRPEGVTKAEAKEIPPEAGEAATPLEAERSAAALPPDPTDITAAIEFAEKQAKAAERRKGTDAWKQEAKEVRSQVADWFKTLVPHQMDEALREGQFKLLESALTPEQKAGLPPEWIAKKGVHPDDLASIYGTQTGVEAINDLMGLVAERAQTGLRADDYRRGLISAEVDRIMESRHSSTEGTLDFAQNQILGDPTIDALHARTVAAAQAAGVEFNPTKAVVERLTQEQFGQLAMKDATVAKFLASAGRAGRSLNKALSEGDVAQVFNYQQRQYASILMAREAKKLEKTVDQFDTFAKRHSARSLESTEQEYMNWIHDILGRVGQPVKRLAEDLRESLERGGETGTQSLADFVEYKELHDLREVPVAEFLMDPAFQSKIGDLTTDQFKQLNDSLKALAQNGRDEKKVYKAGEAADLAEVRKDMIETLDRFPVPERDIKGNKVEFAAGPRRLLRSVVAAHLQIETVLNRLDRWDPKGVWTQYLFRPLAEAANHEARLEKKYSAKLKGIADGEDLGVVIPDSPFLVPGRETVARMTRKNLRAVMLELGNESNFNKLAAGYLREVAGDVPKSEQLAAYKSQIMNWVHTYATEADWKWTQKIWDMFKEVKAESDTMYRNISGIEPESIPIRPIQTRFGEFEGGYYPLIRNKFYGENLKFDKEQLEGQGYIRATTPAGYTKQRTGAIYPLELDLDALPGQLKQIIHDISFRPAVIQGSKFVYDNKLMSQLRDRWSPEIANLFQPWLKDIANQQNFMASKDMKELSYWANFIRQNVTTTLVGLNPSTFMKHTPTAMVSSMAEVGPINFLRELKSLTFINDEFGEKNWSYAMKTSEELQRRHRNWAETLVGGTAELEGTTLGKALKSGEYGDAFLSLRKTVADFSSKPVALGDLMSAVPTWLAKYNAEMEAHGVHGDAVFAADKAVRQAHGSTAMPSRSSISRSPGMSWFTGFFTFFNDLLNRQIETLWKAGEIKGMVKEGEYSEAMKMGQNVSARLTAYVLMPALIEELVTPLASDNNESWGKKAAKGLAFTLASSWVIARDLANAALNGRDPSVGLVSSLLKSGTDIIRDIGAKQGTKPENVIRHGAQLSGFLTGMPPAQVGRTAAGLERYSVGKEHPKGPWGWLVLGRYGTTEKHSKTFDEWLKHH